MQHRDIQMMWSGKGTWIQFPEKQTTANYEETQKRTQCNPPNLQRRKPDPNSELQPKNIYDNLMKENDICNNFNEGMGSE